MWTGKYHEKTVKTRCLRDPIWTWVLSNTKQKCYPYGRDITSRVGCLLSYTIRWREYIRAILTATEEIKPRHTTIQSYKVYFRFFPQRCKRPQWARATLLWRLHDHTQVRHTILLDEWSARRRDLYLTTPNTHKRQTFTPSQGFEPTILASERMQTRALHRAAAGIGLL